MKTYRIHGARPIEIVDVHGGPGDFGGVMQLAATLSAQYGVVEPFQTAHTVMGQVHNLHETITKLVSHPPVIIGHSWGAWLVVIFAATYPSWVRKIILVGSGPYEHRYYPILQQRRNKRFTDEEKRRIARLTAMLSDPKNNATGDVLRQLGVVFSRVDNVDLLEEEAGDVEAIDPAILNMQPLYFPGLLQEATEMRKSGELLRYAKKITCPVVAIHGVQDPHPYEGVQQPLQEHLSSFTCHLIQRCGHKP